MRGKTLISFCDPHRFDSIQVTDKKQYSDSEKCSMHVVKHPDQILPFCLVHSRVHHQEVRKLE
jgi:hypothetical protein